MKPIVAVWKPFGWTPLEVVDALKKRYPDYADRTVSYAGRLDPMAEGVLILLIDGENKRRSFYEGMEKTYSTEFAWGISTDSFDPLGIIRSVNLSQIPDDKVLLGIVSSMKGPVLQEYPPYSSKAVNGKPLYWWARNNRLSEIAMPVKSGHIYDVSADSISKVSVHDFVKGVVGRIERIKGDFRQDQIIRQWRHFEVQYQGASIPLLKVLFRTSSGVYIRGIASSAGQQAACGAIASSIARLSVGEFGKTSCISID